MAKPLSVLFFLFPCATAGFGLQGSREGRRFTGAILLGLLS
jgi:hypothetical protein